MEGALGVLPQEGRLPGTSSLWSHLCSRGVSLQASSSCSGGSLASERRKPGGVGALWEPRGSSCRCSGWLHTQGGLSQVSC